MIERENKLGKEGGKKPGFELYKQKETKMGINNAQTAASLVLNNELQFEEV